MKIRKRNRRNLVALLLALLMAATTLIGCSSTAAEPAKETKSEETTVAVKEETVEVAEVKEAELTPEPTPEPTPEATPEPTPEPIVYEGIDMESTLPGEEWILSLNGYVEEPKLIIFNDSTNKKVIVEEGQEVEFKEDDVLGIYIPSGSGKVKREDMINFNNVFLGEVITLRELFGSIKKGDTVITENIVIFNDEEISLTATLIIK